MRFLLDTHLLIWAADAPEKLSDKADQLINDTDNELWFSVASLWEIAIKYALGRAGFQHSPSVMRSALRANGYGELEVTGDHALAVQHLPNLHRDPFDRLLIAQSQTTGLTLLTADRTVARYPGPILLV